MPRDPKSRRNAAKRLQRIDARMLEKVHGGGEADVFGPVFDPPPPQRPHVDGNPKES